MTRKNAPWIATMLAVYLFMLGLSFAVNSAVGSPSGYAVQCFPASKWDGPRANPEDRPCTVVSETQEDGSVTVLQQTASDEVGRCILPNPYEERGHYVAQCHRVPSIYAH